MQILQKSKKTVPPPPAVTELISKILNTPDEDVAQIVSEIDVWRWARSDLNAWIKVLNKFDTILEGIIREYDIDNVQLKSFEGHTRRTLMEVLRFERLLLENSTNRKMYNSYDRINSLLFTSDLDVLILTLKLLLRPSQQYSAQPAVSQALNISTPRLQSLAKRWPHLREHGVDLRLLTGLHYQEEIEQLPAEVREVNFSFYRTGAVAREPEPTPMDVDVFAATQSSPRKAATPAVPNTGAVTIHIDEETLISKPPMELLAELVEKHSVPESEKFDLLCRIRSARVLTKGMGPERERLIVIRLLAIAIFGHTHSESQAASSLFLYEPDLVNHLAELLQVDKAIPLGVQTTAITALDALARYRSRIQEVLTAVNAGVNHGILMSLLRKTIAHIASADSSIPHSFVEALLSFVTFIASHASGGNMIVGAGLIPLLVQIMDNKHTHRLPVLSKTMQLIDNILYSFTNAFGLFCAAKGVEALVERIAYEVDFDINEHGDMMKSREIYGSHGEIPVARATVLKHILRSLHRMMQSAGTSEGLRGLIDSSILQSIKRIIEYRGLFGPSVLPIAINIMSTFVHNEPSSLSVVQEAGLPEAFYKSIEIGLEPAIEVIQAIPNAIGALCLNEVGQEQLAGHPSIIPAIFSIFTSDRHLKVLLDKENAVLIGTGIDELIRHHPRLKTSVFASIISTLSKIEDLGNAYEPPEAIKHWYLLVPNTTPTSAPAHTGPEDVQMEDSTGLLSPPPLDNATQTQAPVVVDPPEDTTARTKSHDNHIVSFMDVLGRFLEGLFQHPPHCRDFLANTDGLNRLLRLTALPCLPYDFANGVASDSMVQVIRTMSEVSSSQTLQQLSRIVSESLELTRSVWDISDQTSRLLPLLDLSAGQVVNANETFRNMITLYNRVTILSDVFSTAGYAHGRAAITILQTLMSNSTPDVVINLGALHRGGIWENIALKREFIKLGLDVAQTPASSSADGTPQEPDALLADAETQNPPNGDSGETAESSSATPQTTNDKVEKNPGPLDHNAAGLKHLTHGIPNALSPFFTAMVKMFQSRRAPDGPQRTQMSETSSVIALIALQHLTLRPFEDRLSAFAYHTIMLSLLTALMVDERTTSNHLHTVQVLALYRAGVLNVIIDVARQFVASIDRITTIKEESRSEAEVQELLLATAVLRVTVNLFHLLISSKSLFDAGQTAFITTRDIPETSPEYFEPHNFLVRLRLTILPFLQELWQAPWLILVPLNSSKAIVQAVLEICNGESDEGKASDTPNAPQAAGRSQGADESRIRQLTDMGFPRSAAERALQRTHNNVSTATDLLLAQPFPLPPDPEPEPEPTEPEEQEAPTEAVLLASSSSALESSAPAAAPSEPVSSSTEGGMIEDPPATADARADTPEGPKPPAGKTTAEWRQLLNETREPLKAGISRQALLLVDKHPSLIFDLHSAFTRPSNTHQQQAVQDLVSDVRAFSPSAYDVQEQPLANRCRLLALVICETPKSMSPELRSTLMDNLLALLLSNPLSSDDEHPATPKWLASHLLVTEALFTLADQPREIEVPKEGDAVVVSIGSVATGPALSEARNIVFEFCLRLLGIPDLPSDEFLSTLRLFVLLTRDTGAASNFVKREGIKHIFSRVRASPVNGSASYLATILRHCVEIPGSLEVIMRDSIKRLLSQPRPRSIDTVNYVRNCAPMALRDSQVFLSVTKSLCLLNSPFASPTLALKPEHIATPAPKEADTSSAKPTDMVVDDTPVPLPTSSESPEQVVHFLVTELMQTAKLLNDPESGESSEGSDSAREPSPEDQLKDRCQYACFLMQCLAELVFSYDSCKVAMLTFTTKKKSQTPAKDSNTRFKPVVLNFLLTELITFHTVVPQQASDGRDRTTVCSWAMSVMVALCVDSSSAHESKEVSPELVSMRKYVLEAISRALKDPGTSENTEQRYGRTLAMVDLCYRLLTVRFNTSRKQPDETPTHIAKIMLEKSFVASLTSVLSDVDLNYPNVKNLVASILRPLEFLSKVAIRMGRSKAGRDIVVDSASESEHSSDEDDDSDSASREETPDLYRNSALGIYTGEMDDNNYAEDDDEEMLDVDDEDSDGAEEMDFADQTSGSEHTSDTEDENDMQEDVDGEGEAWEDADEDEDDELVNNEGRDGGEVEPDEDEGDSPDEDDEGPDDELAEMIWQDVGGAVVPNVGREDGDDDDDETGAPVHIIHEDEEEREAVSEEEFDELHLNDAVDPTRDMGGPFIARHYPGTRNAADDSAALFGRSRSGQAAPPEATTHPLLLDISGPSARAPHPQPRSSRQRIIAGTQSDLLQTIEELVGNGAPHLFHQVMMRSVGRLGQHEAIRVDVPAGTIMNLERSFRRPGMLQASLRVERAPRPPATTSQARELDPLLTLQRWAEEVKILHGEFATERVTRLANHVIAALLPEAIEAEKQAKIKAEQEEARIHELALKAEAEAREKEREDEAAAVLKAQEAAEVAEATAAAGMSDVGAAQTDSEAPSVVVGTESDAEMGDATAEAATEQSTAPENPASTSNAAAGSSAGETAAPQRVIVMIHDAPVDITDTGIDPSFLEALPDDMREDVLNQHIREQQASRVQRPADSQYSVEFLNALPPDIRAEIIQAEALERSRHRANDATSGTGGPAEIDNASFIASLDPELRQAVLMEQEDGVIQTLPSNMIAEATAYRHDGRQPQWRMRMTASGRARMTPATTSAPKKITPHHDAIQLLDKPGVAVLVRLLFFPQVLRKTLLFRVLLNICENTKTRTELFNILLNILQDGTGDSTIVDKSFSQLSVRGAKLSKSPVKQKSTDILSTLSAPGPQNEAVPDLIAQRCLEALIFIVSSNTNSSVFFLTEHEVPVGLRRSGSKKGKGKEKPTPQSHYPIVLLLNLLDRQSLLRTPSIMESVVALLSTVTRPLATLKDAKPEAVDPTPPAPTAEVTEPPASVEVTATEPASSSVAAASAAVVPEPPAEGSSTQPPTATGAPEQKSLLETPPQIPPASLQLIVNILTIGECSSRTFQQSLALIQHLSYIPDARDVIAQELKAKAQEFGQVQSLDLDELVTALQSTQGDVLIGSLASKFSSSSSSQAKLLRVLKTIDYMYSPKPTNTNSEEDAEKVQAIYESFKFSALWRRLGDCLSIIEERPDTENVATVLLPLIEALMVVCKYVGPKASSSLARAARVTQSPIIPSRPAEAMVDLFVSFTDAHRKILNLMVRNNPSLMSGSFSLLVHNPRVLDFDNKRNYFSQQLHRRPRDQPHAGTLSLGLRRARVFEDSFQQLIHKTGDQIKYGKLSVRFFDEEGVDAGGLSREWFQILARQMFDPNNALFQPCAADRQTYQPNKNSWINKDHLMFFKFVGRVIGKAIYDGRLLDAYFARSLYRQLLGKPVDYKDVEWVDPEYYNSLCWILENDPTLLELTFSVEADEFGVNRIVPLKEGGDGIAVTDENKQEFVMLSAQYRLYESIKDQIEHLSAGFYEIIPKDLLQIFNEQELELLISGTPDIEVDEWRAATEYNGYTSSDPNIVWWWRALKSFTRDEKAKVLSFATGTSRVPLGGFIELQGVQGTQKFSIHKAYGDDRLPQAHTCFNQIDLPQYSSYEMLRQQLLLAINEGGEGFGFV